MKKTSSVLRKVIAAALAALKALPVVDEIRSVIRVEQERG